MRQTTKKNKATFGGNEKCPIYWSSGNTAIKNSSDCALKMSTLYINHTLKS